MIPNSEDVKDVILLDNLVVMEDDLVEIPDMPGEYYVLKVWHDSRMCNIDLYGDPHTIKYADIETLNRQIVLDI